MTFNGFTNVKRLILTITTSNACIKSLYQLQTYGISYDYLLHLSLSSPNSKIFY